ncbi:uncharacterized protein LOC126811185 isoform X2 [Patella vulgata]|uniref:uncharacterized protein LOC126811185 isoform X2 n=1 Tax=Patella vulgata TaxID=6465 RepID=UPI002180798F|nr:uncharacterized protein LOC126811185 isoform X2 [Patella vulgata]
MRHERTDMYSRPKEFFPYIPLQSDVCDNAFKSREKSSMTSSFKSGSRITDIGTWRKNLSPQHLDKSFHLPIEKLALSPLDNTPRQRYAGVPMVRQMDGLSSNRIQDDIEVNPQPAPFKSEDFMSSTVMKNVPISKRHLDNFTTLDNKYSGKRGVALHTQRYNFDTNRSLDSLTQRDRLLAEIEALEKLRDIKRKTEILPHRLPLDLCMGGKRLDIEERFDINREIRRLKAMVLPQYAKDLYHGRGIHLPSHHASIKPRQQPIPDNDSDDGFSASAPASLRRMPPRHMFDSESSTSFMDFLPSSHRTEKLPSIKRQPNLGFSLVQSLSHSKSNVLPRVHRNPSSWVEEQNQHLQDRQEKSSSKETVNIKLPDEARSEGDNVSPGPPPPTAGGASLQSLNKTQPLTPYPLKGSELVSTVPDDQKQALRETFERLDADSDGHLKYNELLPVLPSKFSPQQEQFVKQVYDITSSGTYFGIDEFLTMSQLGENMKELGKEASDAYEILDDIDIKNFTIKYVELFQRVDTSQRGSISVNSLQEILSTVFEKNLKLDSTLWNRIICSINLTVPEYITKIEYLAHLPYFHMLGTKTL